MNQRCVKLKMNNDGNKKDELREREAGRREALTMLHAFFQGNLNKIAAAMAAPEGAAFEAAWEAVGKTLYESNQAMNSLMFKLAEELRDER